MNLYDIPRAVTECAVDLGGVFSSDIMCSITVNAAILAVVLLSTVRLLGPLCSKGLDDSFLNREGNS